MPFPRQHFGDVGVFLGLLVLALLARGQTFGNPVLGFDEQFYLLVGDRMLQSAVPYVDIFDRKPIGLFLIYAAIRGLGGDGFLQYKLVACGFAALTAFVIYRGARSIGTGFAAGVAAALYLLWLDLMGGEGGQAEVFFNLPMAMAGLVTWESMRRREPGVRPGVLAMLLAGVAMQIKYTAVVEGVFFGCVLLWARYRSRGSLLAAAAVAPLWIGCALIPTVLAALAYWWMGALQPFVFANFLSISGRAPDPVADQMAGLLKLGVLLLPLLLFAGLSWRWRKSATVRVSGFPYLWLGASIAGVLLFASFLDPHYGMPVLVPVSIAAAPFFARARGTRLVAGLVLTAVLIGGQVGIALGKMHKGGRKQAMAVAVAARPHRGCIYVYDGFPALYMLTRSCLPTRWAFPGHLNTRDEASEQALGVDPAAEVRRILATRPEVIVDDWPAYALGNAETRALVEAALARDYHLTAKVATGTARYRLVYRLNGD